ncbi:hypothetical protein SAY86_029505 [Trapa natans]|uniref:Uncharacterized protein n=1 Tax=Trapa natans TaxID=22666 RepID=A0AAN7R9P6_TRANT|nr:hypothetical protein SAY86_029505 [Trapa natans]
MNDKESGIPVLQWRKKIGIRREYEPNTVERPTDKANRCDVSEAKPRERTPRSLHRI